jgi:hypothetical protein
VAGAGVVSPKERALALIESGREQLRQATTAELANQPADELLATGVVELACAAIYALVSIADAVQELADRAGDGRRVR